MEDYNIKGSPYSVVVDFNAGSGRIFGRSMNKPFTLDEYVAFKGNMKDFITHHITNGELL